MALSEVIAKEGLSERWVEIFKDELGIKTIQGLKYIGKESYPLLVQFVTEPLEKRYLLKLLGIEAAEKQSLTINCTKMFLGKKEELEKALKQLRNLQGLRKYRQDSDVQAVESVCQEILQVPEGAWFGESLILDEVIENVCGMIRCFEKAHEDEDSNELPFLLQVSGGLSLDSVGGIVLKGVWVIEEASNFVLRSSNMLKAPTDIQLNFPLRPQFTETKHFQSREQEREFFDQLAKTGYSMPTTDKMNIIRASQAYCSTIRYCFMPMATYYFDNDQLYLSDYALSSLSEIDRLITGDKAVEKGCQAFFEEFGSHCLQGPFHFGGLYICKCYSSGFPSFSNVKELKRIQDEVINAQMRMCFSPCYEEICVSQLKGISGQERLKNNVKLQVITVGGPKRACGFPDWKNSLSGSNCRWKLIDCGISKLPVWDIIVLNHKKHFKNVEKLASMLRQCWKRSVMKTNEGGNDSLHKKFSNFVKSLQLEEAMVQTQLNALVTKRKEVEQLTCDPRAWALEYLPILQEYFCFIIKNCKVDKIKSLLKLVVEPVDLGLTAIFPFESMGYTLKCIYGTERELPQLLCDDFVHFGRYIDQAVAIVSSMPGVPCPYLIAKGTSLVERAVQLLRQHLLRAGQPYEECLLLTILHAQKYNPENQKFLALVSRKDFEILNHHFKAWSQNFFTLNQQSDLQKQSYLMYLTVHVSHTMGGTEECIDFHVKFLQQKLNLMPEIQSILKPGIDWENFQTVMKDMCNGAVIDQNRAKNSLLPSSEIEQQNQVEVLKHPVEKHQHILATQPPPKPLRKPLQPQTRKVPPLKNTGEHFSMTGMELKSSKQTENIPDQFEQHTRIGQKQSRSLSTQHQLTPPTEHPISFLLEKVGLTDYYPQKLSCRDAIEIREDTINLAKNNCSQLYPFIMLQKIMAFDSKCRIPLHGLQHNESVSDSDSDSDSDESESGDSIHPMDGLLALLLCCDTFLRQDLFCRMATSHISVPLLLPNPHTGDPTLLLWALRSIVKEFKLPDGKTYSGRIISYQTPFVSFLRVGKHSISKSEILNGVINKTNSDNKIEAFIGYNSPGGTSCKRLVKGLVELTWYLPGNGLFSQPIAFTNLRGDACDPDLQKQVNVLCSISTVSVVLLANNMLDEDASRGSTINLLKQLSQAPEGLIILQSKKDKKGFKSQISGCIGETLFKTKCTLVNCDKSVTVFLENLQTKIKNKLQTTNVQPSLVEMAKKCNITIDEDVFECVRGRQLMEQLFKVVEDHRRQNPTKSPKDLLPLQSEKYWHRWADLDKEQYRQKRKYQHEVSRVHWQEKEEPRERQRKVDWTAMEYGEEQRRRMNEIRIKQYPLATKSSGLLFLFLETLRKEEKKVLQYYMIWLKFRLDDLSRDILPPFYVDIRKKRKELSDIQQKHDEVAEKKCQAELKHLDHQLLHASFGLEHLFREVGQMYEAVEEQTDATNELIGYLPQMAAQLLYDGFPLELLDGDASHIPKKWISMVFNSLAEILQQKHGFDPHVYILSVLGVQSTGKSTLLNTVFGVQFSVSAGRCTRGAFMQLIPVHHSLHKQMGVQYFLLIDTEGLRAPELDRLEVREHDNELATFVIGMANLTLINVSGEVSGDIDDILHTVVHAFLRMNQVQLKPSCRIIHQHVVAVGADEKLMQGRLKTKDNLDKMTKAAAKETGVEVHYTHFSDVIKFDHEYDVSFFPDLWNGKPPMARVDSGYSEEAQQLKLSVIASSRAIAKHSVPNINTHLQRLWKAILQEDFVFTFQNTFEIIAFKTLEGKYGDWSWYFKSDMSEWERMAEKKLCRCSPEEIDHARATLLQSLQQFSHEKHQKYEKMMLDYFDESNNENMLKWKPDMMPRLQHLCDTLERHADEHCTQVYQAQRDRTEADNERGELNTMILERIQQLIVTLGERKATKDELIGIFDDQWCQWMKRLTSKLKSFVQPDVAKEVENCLNRESSSDQKKYVNEKLGDKESGKQLRKWGVRLVLTIQEHHIKVLQPSIWGTNLIPFWNKMPKIQSFFPLAQQHTSTTLSAVEASLKKIKHSDRNFSPQLVTELIHLIKEKRKVQLEGFKFTDEYDVDLALTACGYAISFFEKMAEAFRRKHDPKVYVEFEMKPQFRKLFLNMYDKVGNEKIVADTLCYQLEEPVKAFVIESLPSKIVSEMRGKYPYIKDKQSFIANILLEIGEMLNNQSEDGFKLCICFLTDVRASIEWWSAHFVQKHCNSGSPPRLYEIATDELNDIIDLIIEGAKKVTASRESFSMSEWLQEFHSVALEGKINLNQQIYTTSQEFSDVKFFTKEVIRGLNELKKKKLNQYFSENGYLDILKRELPHEIIFEMVAGCTEQCPFCKAQCELTSDKHSTNIKHQTQHRPRCLGGRRWEGQNTMVLDVCTYSVSSDSDTCFKTERSEWKWHAYKDYVKIYPEWTIPADKSLESSLFWKWFIGNYSSKVEDFFGHEETEIPSEWKKLKWANVKEWLKKEYHL